MEKKLIISICGSSDSFGAFAENCEGIYASGLTIEDVKDDVIEAIRLYKENRPEEQWAEPIKEEWPIAWKYDTQSLLTYFQGSISKATLERRTGINQKQLWNYSKGISKPRKAAQEKITNALRTLSKDLWEACAYL